MTKNIYDDIPKDSYWDGLGEMLLAQTDELAKLEFEPGTPEHKFQQISMQHAKAYREAKAKDDLKEKKQ